MTDRTPCEVLVDGRWVPGWLIRWRSTDQGWRGLVEYTTGGLGYYQERPADELRPREQH